MLRFFLVGEWPLLGLNRLLLFFLLRLLLIVRLRSVSSPTRCHAECRGQEGNKKTSKSLLQDAPSLGVATRVVPTAPYHGDSVNQGLLRESKKIHKEPVDLAPILQESPLSETQGNIIKIVEL